MICYLNHYLTGEVYRPFAFSKISLQIALQSLILISMDYILISQGLLLSQKIWFRMVKFQKKMVLPKKNLKAVLHRTICMMRFVWVLFIFKISLYKSGEIEPIFWKSYHTYFDAEICYDFVIYMFRLVNHTKTE